MCFLRSDVLKIHRWIVFEISHLADLPLSRTSPLYLTYANGISNHQHGYLFFKYPHFSKKKIDKINVSIDWINLIADQNPPTKSSPTANLKSNPPTQTRLPTCHTVRSTYFAILRSCASAANSLDPKYMHLLGRITVSSTSPSSSSSSSSCGLVPRFPIALHHRLLNERPEQSQSFNITGIANSNPTLQGERVSEEQKDDPSKRKQNYHHNTVSLSLSHIVIFMRANSTSALRRCVWFLRPLIWLMFWRSLRHRCH